MLLNSNKTYNYASLGPMKWLLLSVTIFLILASALAIASVFYYKFYDYRFFPGVKINGQGLKGLNSGQAIEQLQQQADDFLQQGITYVFDEKKINISLLLMAEADPDVAIQLINFKIAETVDAAYHIGRGQGYTKNFWQQTKSLIFDANLPLVFEFYQEQYLEILQNDLQTYTLKKTEARPKFDAELNLEILAENAGTSFNYQLILLETINRISQLSNEPIAISLIIDEPEVKKADINEAKIAELKNFASISTLINLIYNNNENNNEWQINNQIFKDWIIFKKADDKITLGFDASATTAYLINQLAPEINRPILEGKFEIKNGRVVEFQGSQDGLELDLEKSLFKIEEEIFLRNNFTVELVVNELKAKITTGSINDFGIAEVVGTGQSDFSGSPNNRKHNISVGANSLNGILIKPGEEFSLIKALGKINAESGYKPELVIKGDRTIAEFGGGLCQVGTTMFRAALASGLPITLRRPHSYRVSYYEPAGKDATIYDPWPDLKFINDTEYNILIQSRIEGNDLYFDFWGTKDGRQVEQTDSVIYNITSPGPTQYIETEELEPGKESCIESAHAGADAYFDYKVTYPSGEIKEEKFSSHYIPWPKKCLVGVQLSNEATATSTTEIIEE